MNARILCLEFPVSFTLLESIGKRRKPRGGVCATIFYLKFVVWKQRKRVKRNVVDHNDGQSMGFDSLCCNQRGPASMYRTCQVATKLPRTGAGTTVFYLNVTKGKSRQSADCLALNVEREVDCNHVVLNRS